MKIHELKKLIREEISLLKEGHDGIMGVSKYSNVEDAKKYWEGAIRDSRNYGGDLNKFRGVRYVGRLSDEDALDNIASKYEDEYVILATIDGEIWQSYWRRS